MFPPLWKDNLLVILKTSEEQAEQSAQVSWRDSPNTNKVQLGAPLLQNQIG